MVECELPKLNMRVRFPLPAPTKATQLAGWFFGYNQDLNVSSQTSFPFKPVTPPLAKHSYLG